jgi:hypothetical protein
VITKIKKPETEVNEVEDEDEAEDESEDDVEAVGVAGIKTEGEEGVVDEWT